MKKSIDIEEAVFAMVKEASGKFGLIPVDVEYVKEKDGYYLNIYIDKEGGVSIDDCEALSRYLDPLLDEADLIGDAYTMIVSSPGLGRVLKRPRDFLFGMGKEVDIKTYAAVDGSKEFTGILDAADDKTLTILTDKETKTFDRKNIAVVKLTVSF